MTELINRVPNPASDEVVWDFRAYAKIWPDLTNCNSHDKSHWVSHVDYSLNKKLAGLGLMCGGECVAIDLGGSLFSNFLQLVMSNFFL